MRILSSHDNTVEVHRPAYGSFAWRRLARRVERLRTTDLAAFLFLLVYMRDLVVVMYPPVISVGAFTLIFAVTLFPRLPRRTWFWALLIIPNAWIIVGRPYDSSNHGYLELYTILAFLIGSRVHAYPERLHYLRTVSGYLLALCMAFAVTHKCLSSSYRDGSFLYYSWLTGDFFPHWLNSLVVDDFQSIIELNKQRVVSVLSARQAGASVTLESPAGLLPAFRLVGLFVILVEAVIPVLFFIEKARRIRHPVLLGFVLGTAVFTPEFTFLSLLSLWGLLQCREDDTKTKIAYVALILVLSAFGFTYILRPTR